MSNENGGSRCSFRYASPVLGSPSSHPTGFGHEHDNRHSSNRHSHPTLKRDRHQHHHQDRDQAERFCYSQVRDVTGGRQGDGLGSTDVDAIKAKIVAHPQYSYLLHAHMDCQKIGAPPELVKNLSRERERSSVTSVEASSKDPDLDQFMEAYYNMLVKYKEELTRPLQEAMEFIRKMETQLDSLSKNGQQLGAGASFLSNVSSLLGL